MCIKFMGGISVLWHCSKLSNWSKLAKLTLKGLVSSQFGNIDILGLCHSVYNVEGAEFPFLRDEIGILEASISKALDCFLRDLQPFSGFHLMFGTSVFDYFTVLLLFLCFSCMLLTY